MDVDQQTHVSPAQPQVGEWLSLVPRVDRLNALDFDDY